MILHIDMDAFYASVEIRDRPDLRDVPVVVGGDPTKRGVVCAANYLAREYGVHSAQPSRTAAKLCPHAVFLRPRMSHYARISNEIREIFYRYTPLVEPLSFDEAFLDVTGSEQLFGTSVEIGKQIKAEIWNELRLVASVGVAPNKFLAKVASDLEKPDGFVIVLDDEVQQFLDPLPVSRLWGVGPKTNQRLSTLGIKTVASLRKLSQDAIQQILGREHGQHLSRLARGVDARAVVPDRQAKSISHETTFAEDLTAPDELRAWVLELADQVAIRLRRCSLRGQSINLKTRFHDFQTLTRTTRVAESTDVSSVIADAAVSMLTQLLKKHPKPVRLLGVGVASFEVGGARQGSLFDKHEAPSAVGHDAKIDAASDEIRRRFGDDSLVRGSRLMHGAKHRRNPDQT